MLHAIAVQSRVEELLRRKFHEDIAQKEPFLRGGGLRGTSAPRHILETLHLVQSYSRAHDYRAPGWQHRSRYHSSLLHQEIGLSRPIFRERLPDPRSRATGSLGPRELADRPQHRRADRKFEPTQAY